MNSVKYMETSTIFQTAVQFINVSRPLCARRVLFNLNQENDVKFLFGMLILEVHVSLIGEDDHLFSFFIFTLLRLNRLEAHVRGAKCSQTSMYRGDFFGLVHTSDGIKSGVGIRSTRIRDRKRSRKIDGIGV